MKITIDLDESILEQAVENAWNAVLSSPSGYGAGGAAYQQVARQVVEYGKAIDCGELIKTEIARQLPAIVAEVVNKTLTEMVRKAVKHHKDSGQLALDMQDAGEE